MVLGIPLLLFGLVILLGAVVRFGGGNLTQPLSSYLAAIVFGGALPVAVGFFLIYKGVKKNA